MVPSHNTFSTFPTTRDPERRPITSPLFRWILLFVGVLILPLQASAQGSKPVAVPRDTRSPSKPFPAPRTKPPDAAPAAVGGGELSDSVFRWEPLGLAIQLPVGSVAESTRIGDRATVRVAPAPPDDSWVFNIQAPRTSNADATIADAVEKTLTQINEAFGVSGPGGTVVESKARVLERIDSLKLAGGEAARFYVLLPRGDGTELVKGYTIFKPSPTQYAVFEFITPAPAFAKSRLHYELSVATAYFEDAQAVNLARGALVQAGQVFLKDIPQKDYAALFDGREIWHRLYTPSATGASLDAKEHGYRGLKFFKGRRSDLGGSSSVKPGRQNGGDNTEGYLVSLRARLLLDNSTGSSKNAARYIDSNATYFVTPDRSEEVWTVTTAVKDTDGRTLGTATEVGGRSGDQLEVAVDESGKPGRALRPPVPRGYMSQVDTLLLARLLVRARVETTIGSYGYQSASESVPFRKDAAKRLSGEGADGLWTVETFFREGQPPQITTYSSDGELLRTEMPDGRMWEPSDLEGLLRTWRSKGLPTDK